METVLLHKSSFLCITPVSRLSSFGFANALLTGVTKTFVPFYSAFPEIFRNFAVNLRKHLMKHINLRLFSSFFKIGAFTFGGGWAMISLLEEDIVNKHKWLEKEEFIDNLAIAQSLPGIMAVNVAIAVGYKLNKIWGSIFAVLGTILPSFLIILAIAMFLTPDTIKNNETLTRIFKGIRPAVVALILSPVFTTAKSAKISWKNAWIPIAISLLIWSNIPVVSSPILYIIIGGLFGYFIYSKNFRTAVEKQEGDKQ